MSLHRNSVVNPHIDVIPGTRALDLLRRLTTLGRLMTIVVHEGSVFEYPGGFPWGEEADGYYNLHGDEGGFQGHLRLDRIARIALISRLHRGRMAHAFVIENMAGEAIFKVFLGRDQNGQIASYQLSAFDTIKGEITRGDWS